MPHFDWTVHFGDLIIATGGGFAIRMMLKQRDFYLTMTRVLMGDEKEGELGLIRRVKQLEGDMYERKGTVSRIHHWIANATAGLLKHDISLPPRE